MIAHRQIAMPFLGGDVGGSNRAGVAQCAGHADICAGSIPAGGATWLVSHKYDRDCVHLVDGTGPWEGCDPHYSRRKIGSPQFMPPGETLVLVTPARNSVFGWWRPHPRSGVTAMNGLDGWTCTIFRRMGGAKASDLVLAAELALADADTAAPCGADGLLTYVPPSKINSTNPGWCFQLAGWVKNGWSKKTG